jgi:hypothetical protein
MSALPDAGGPAADLLVTAGVMAAVPTAAAGLHELVRHRRTADPGRAGARRAEHHRAKPVPGLADRARPGRRCGGQALAPAVLGVLLGSGYLGGHNQRWLHHPPVARQHLPVRLSQHRAQPGQHARAQLPDAHPEGRIEVRAFT